MSGCATHLQERPERGLRELQADLSARDVHGAAHPKCHHTAQQINEAKSSWGWSLVVFSRAQHWGQVSLVFLSIIWMEESSIPSVSWTGGSQSPS